jgi:hypothetical protein
MLAVGTLRNHLHVEETLILLRTRNDHFVDHCISMLILATLCRNRISANDIFTTSSWRPISNFIDIATTHSLCVVALAWHRRDNECSA